MTREMVLRRRPSGIRGLRERFGHRGLQAADTLSGWPACNLPRQAAHCRQLLPPDIGVHNSALRSEPRRDYEAKNLSRRHCCELHTADREV